MSGRAWAVVLVVCLAPLVAFEVWTLTNGVPGDTLTAYVLQWADRWQYGRAALVVAGFAAASWWAFHIRRKTGERR